MKYRGMLTVEEVLTDLEEVSGILSSEVITHGYSIQADPFIQALERLRGIHRTLTTSRNINDIHAELFFFEKYVSGEAKDKIGKLRNALRATSMTIVPKFLPLE